MWRISSIASAILVFCTVGVYSLNYNVFDILVTAAFGLVGYVWSKLRCEGAPLLLGLVLGPMMEENFRRALLLARGDFTVFVTRPLSAYADGPVDLNDIAGGDGVLLVDYDESDPRGFEQGLAAAVNGLAADPALATRLGRAGRARAVDHFARAARSGPVPSPLRDAGYRWLARNRYRIFGRSRQCLVPPPHAQRGAVGHRHARDHAIAVHRFEKVRAGDVDVFSLHRLALSERWARVAWRNHSELGLMLSATQTDPALMAGGAGTEDPADHDRGDRDHGAERAASQPLLPRPQRRLRIAQALGYRIKHLGIAKRTDAGVELRAHATLVPEDRLLAKVDGVLNTVLLQGNAVGQIGLYGRGAGGDATASAVVADLVDVARALGSDARHHVPSLAFQPVCSMWVASSSKKRFTT